MIIDEILDMMDDMLDEASSVPFSSKKGVIDLDKMRGCINDLRLNLPDEIRNAKNIVRDRQEIVSDANKEADQIVRRASITSGTSAKRKRFMPLPRPFWTGTGTSTS